MHGYTVDTRIPFVGRERELERLRPLLDARQSVTLVGPGGVGKSRLAVEAAERWAAKHAAPVTFVSLVGVAPEEIAGTVAVSLGIERTPGRSLLQLLEDTKLEPNHTIVLDNCEDAVAAVHDVIERLRTHDGVAIVATSRVPLRFEDETPFEVAPFDTAEGVEFFSARAALINVLVSQDGDREVVRGIVERLDGLAVAIDLAAARLVSLNVRELRDELSNPRPYHFRSSASSEPRHWSLNHVVDWSLSKLKPRFVDVFVRCGRFATVFTAGDIAALRDGDPESAKEILDELVEQSLIVRVGDADKYSMLAPIRAVAKQRFSRLRNRRDLESQFARHVNAFGSSIVNDPHNSAGLIPQIGERYDDFVNVLLWALEEPEERAQLVVSVFGALTLIWSDGGRFNEGLPWCDRFLGITHSLEPRSRARVYYNVLRIAHAAGEFERMLEIGPQLISAFTIVNDRLGLARAYNGLSVACLDLGRPEEAKTYVDTSLALYESLGHEIGITSAIINQGNVALEGYGDTAKARERYFQGLQMARAAKSDSMIALAFANLAVASHYTHDGVETKRWASLALECFENLGNPSRSAWMRQFLARVLAATGDLRGAARELDEAFRLLRKQPNPAFLALCIESVANLLVLRGEFETATILMKACERYRTERRVPAVGSALSDVRITNESARAALDAEAQQRATEAAARVDLRDLADISRLILAEF
jgi:tetratricopeptide (TPR) repeat protein